MPGYKILFIGASSLELNINTYKIPEAGECVVDDGGVAYIPGGRVPTTAACAAKMGADSLICTRLGADLHGRQLFSYYKDSGIDTAYVKADRVKPTGFSVILKEADGKERVIKYPGANLALTEGNIIEAFDAAPDAVLLTLDLPVALVSAAVRAATERDIPVFVDANSAPKDYPFDELPELEVFLANSDEMQEYTGQMPAGATASLRSALAIAKRVKAKYYVIKQGARGSFLYDGKHYKMEAALRLDKPIDTAGVGDIYAAALVLEYARSGGDIATAIRYATVATAISVTREGAASSTPKDEEVMAVYNRTYT